MQKIGRVGLIAVLVTGAGVLGLVTLVAVGQIRGGDGTVAITVDCEGVYA